MDLGFRGEVTDFYHRYRRGYPAAVLDRLVDAFALTRDDVALDVGCGTGQLTLPLAERVRAVAGLDPEPDMLARARAAARERSAGNVSWLLGADADVPALGSLFGPARLGVATVAQALHWMDHDALFRALGPLLRPGGGVAVVTNGAPSWLHGTAWSRALRETLAEWLGTPLVRTCGTDETSGRRYRESLEAAGFAVRAEHVRYSEELSLDGVVGGVFSALSVQQLPDEDGRRELADRIGHALGPHRLFVEEVDVTLLLGTRQPSASGAV